MGKGTPRAPTPPDYNAAARAQGVENIATARAQAKLNTPNTYTPYGNQTVSWAQPVFDQKGFNTATAGLVRPSLTDAKYGGAAGSGTFKADEDKYNLDLNNISKTTGGVFDPVKYSSYLEANPQTYNQDRFDVWKDETTTAINNLPRSGVRGAFNQGAYDDAVSDAQAAFEEGPAYGNFYPPNSDSDEFYFPSTNVDPNALANYYRQNPTKTLQDFKNQSTTTKLKTDPYFMTGSTPNADYADQVAALGPPPRATDSKYQTGAANQGLYDTDKAAYDSTIQTFRDQYTSSADSDTPTVTQTLTPDAQRALTAQQQIEAGLSESARDYALPTIRDAMSSKFDTSGYDLRRDLGPQDTMNYGPAMGAYGLSGSVGPGSFGYAGGLGAGQYGLAQGGVAGPTIQSNFGGYGGVQDSPFGGQYGRAGGIGQYGAAQGPDISGYGQAGGVNAGAYGLAQGINAGQFGNLMTGANMSGVAAMPVTAGMTGQQAIMARLQPQLERQAAATAQQLANQGITPGSEAYNNAMREQQQGQNDLLSQAALQGIGLDMSANQQGYGQAMGQAGLYNQAMGQGFGQGFQAQQLGNQAIGQNYGQGLSAQQLGNQAVGQNVGFGLQANAAQNAAVGQNFGQGFQAQQLGNQAIGQNFGQGMQSNAAQNAAQAQRYGQAAGNAQFGNEAQLSQFQANLANQQAGNQAVAQNYGQGLSAQQLGNQAIGQNVGFGLQANAAQNAAVGQNFGQGFQAQQLGNQAIGQNFGQGMQSNAAQNAAQAQRYGQAAGLAQFGNEAQLSQFQANLANQQAGNQAVAQNYGQGMSSQELQNRAASQNYGQGITSQNQANAAMAQNYAQAAASAGLYNQAAAQRYNQALGAAQFYNQGQQQQLQQNLALRNQPLNEIMGLLSGAQIQTPQFQGYTGGGNIQAAPVFQGVQQQGQAAMDLYGQQMAAANAQTAGMYSLGSAALGGASKMYKFGG